MCYQALSNILKDLMLLHEIHLYSLGNINDSSEFTYTKELPKEFFNYKIDSWLK